MGRRFCFWKLRRERFVEYLIVEEQFGVGVGVRGNFAISYDPEPDPMILRGKLKGSHPLLLHLHQRARFKILGKFRYTQNLSLPPSLSLSPKTIHQQRHQSLPHTPDHHQSTTTGASHIRRPTATEAPTDRRARHHRRRTTSRPKPLIHHHWIFATKVAPPPAPHHHQFLAPYYFPTALITIQQIFRAMQNAISEVFPFAGDYRDVVIVLELESSQAR
ncbi:uncharacterized protein LOC131307312 isoform X2 [Rhododendron vialii]|uniref:uncharacterized protein LOC131307312 isoform X2 n=1 Tax=Rhododendron vialii TaxID=182163 RepID=UPI00265E8BD4|nr:uncharacterized protein LOC131307312 isoform X2 [Rhododendron vialii]